MTIETTRFDIREHIRDPEDQIVYLSAALEDGDADLIAAALGDIARVRGATEFARQAGLSRETVYKALRPGGNPTLETLAKSVKALGLKLSLVPA